MKLSKKYDLIVYPVGSPSISLYKPPESHFKSDIKKTPSGFDEYLNQEMLKYEKPEEKEISPVTRLQIDKLGRLRL